MTPVMSRAAPPFLRPSTRYAAHVKRRWRLLPNDPDLGWVPQVWIFYLAFVFLTPLLGEFGGERMWAATLASALVFVPLYFLAFWLQGHRRVALAFVMALIGAALAPLNAGASVYFIYAAYFGGMSYDRPKPGLVVVGALLGLVGLTSWLLAPTIYFAGPTTVGVVVLGLLGIHYARRHREVGELRMARAEIETLARIAERDRIAGDLHDLLGQTLSLIVLKSELTAALVSRDPERARREAEDIQSIARRALTEVRTAVRGYRVGSGAGLIHEIDGAAQALEAADVALHFGRGPETITTHLDAAREAVLALAIRESATNIIRHARATSCQIQFFDEGDRYGVEIVDDGRGLGDAWGNGLHGMRQRVEAQGGRLLLTGDDGGTRVRVEFCERDGQAAREGEAA